MFSPCLGLDSATAELSRVNIIPVIMGKRRYERFNFHPQPFQSIPAPIRRLAGKKLFFPEEVPGIIAEEARRLWGVA
jgi:hypothetical protein